MKDLDEGRSCSIWKGTATIEPRPLALAATFSPVKDSTQILVLGMLTKFKLFSSLCFYLVKELILKSIVSEKNFTFCAESYPLLYAVYEKKLINVRFRSSSAASISRSHLRRSPITREKALSYMK